MSDALQHPVERLDGAVGHVAQEPAEFGLVRAQVVHGSVAFGQVAVRGSDLAVDGHAVGRLASFLHLPAGVALVDGGHAVDALFLKAAVVDAHALGQQPVAHVGPALAHAQQHGLGAQRVLADGDALPLLAVALVHLLHAGLRVDDRDALAVPVQRERGLLLEPRPFPGPRVDPAVGDEDVRVRVPPLAVQMDRVGRRVPAGGQVLTDEPFHRQDALPLVQLARQGHHDLLRGHARAALRRLGGVEQALRIRVAAGRALGQERRHMGHALPAPEPGIGLAPRVVPHAHRRDVRQRGHGAGRAGDVQRVDRHGDLLPRVRARGFSRGRPEAP